jgi:hypothetical protein
LGFAVLEVGRIGVTSGVALVFSDGLFSFDPGLFNKRPQFGYCFFIVSDVRAVMSMPHPKNGRSVRLLQP